MKQYVVQFEDDEDKKKTKAGDKKGSDKKGDDKEGSKDPLDLAREDYPVFEALNLLKGLSLLGSK